MDQFEEVFDIDDMYDMKTSNLHNDSLNEIQKNVTEIINTKNIKQADTLTTKTKKKINKLQTTLHASLDQMKDDNNQIEISNISNISEKHFVDCMKRMTEIKDIFETQFDTISIENSISLYHELNQLIANCQTYTDTYKLKISYL